MSLAIENKTPTHVAASTWQQIGFFIADNPKVEIDGKLMPHNCTTNNTAGSKTMQSIARFFNESEENAKIMKIIFKNCCDKNVGKKNFVPADFLKHRSNENPIYQSDETTVSEPDGGPIHTSTGTGTITQDPSKSSDGKGVQQKITTFDQMTIWMESKFKTVAKDSQIAEINNKIIKLQSDLEDEAKDFENKLTGVETIATDAKELAETNEAAIKQLQLDIGEANKNLNGFVLTAAATEFVNGAEKFWKQSRFDLRSGIFMLVIKNPDLYTITPSPSLGGDPTYELKFGNLKNYLGVKISLVENFKLRMSENDNLVAKCRITGYKPYETGNKLLELLDKKSSLKEVYISRIISSEYDISPVLDTWKAHSSLIKYVTTKYGGITGYINDGVEKPESGSVEAVTADENCFAYLDSCSRINFSNPMAIASLANPTIENLRIIASGAGFVYRGEIYNYPTDFKRKIQKPGFLNSTYE